MSPHTRHEPAAPTGAETTTLYVAIDISRKSWVVGLKSPLGEKIEVTIQCGWMRGWAASLARPAVSAAVRTRPCRHDAEATAQVPSRLSQATSGHDGAIGTMSGKAIVPGVVVPQPSLTPMNGNGFLALHNRVSTSVRPSRNDARARLPPRLFDFVFVMNH